MEQDSVVEGATFTMRCPQCKKNTPCLKMTKEKKGLSEGEAPRVKQFKCTVCGTGWNVNTGGSFNASLL